SGRRGLFQTVKKQKSRRTGLHHWGFGCVWCHKEDKQMKLTIGETVLTATLADNSSVKALEEKLKDGPITIQMEDYARMEKVGNLPSRRPTNDQSITTKASDLILYLGNSFVIYYAPNSWRFTQLGHIEGVTAQELKKILGRGDVTVTLSLD